MRHCFAERGLEAVFPQPPGFAPDGARRRRIEEALDRLLQRPQTWTVTTLLEALAAAEDIHLQPRTVRLYRKRMGPRGDARPRVPPAGPRPGDHGGDNAGGPQKKYRDAERDLFFLDETSFRPSLPPYCTRAPPGVRPVVPHENPEGRRLNVLAALAASGTHRHAPLPGRTGSPRIVVFDNAGLHRARTVRQARRALAKQGIGLWYLSAPVRS